MRAHGLSVAALLSMAACNCGGLTESSDDDGGSGGGGSGSTGGGSAGAGGGSGGGTDSPDASCAAVSSTATLGKKPVDVIMVIDNSGSMTEEITGVEANINANFAQILGASNLDYRVILLSKHGSASATQSICISAPLSGAATCTPPPAAPANTARFFQYDIEISSTNSLQRILDTYATADTHSFAPMGWRQWLRSDAFKVFVEITDDNSSLSASAFETQLLALTPAQFGTALARNYMFHSIVGVAQKANPADAYLPSEPLVTTKCSSAVNTGSAYQPLSKTTGGLRFPLCDPSKYNTVFQSIAQGVVAGAKVACDFTMPPPPAGFTMFNRIIVNYTPGAGGPVQGFTKAADATACAADKYTLSTDHIVLCPQACAVVQADPMAKVDVLFTCEPEIN